MDSLISIWMNHNREAYSLSLGAYIDAVCVYQFVRKDLEFRFQTQRLNNQNNSKS